MLVSIFSCTKNNVKDDFKLNDFKNANIGVVIGAVDRIYLANKLPDANPIDFADATSAILALKQNKIDGLTTEISSYFEFKKTDKNYRYIEEPIGYNNQGLAVNKNIKENFKYDLIAELNEFIAESKENGFLLELQNKWFTEDDTKATFEKKVINNPKEKLQVAIYVAIPYVILQNNEWAGFDIEFFETFCEKYNYDYEFKVYDFAAMLAAVSTGKSHIAMGAITITEERKQQMLFTDSHVSESVNIIYYTDTNDNTSIIDAIKKGFYSSFIAENRYKLYLYGCFITIVITICSIILGIVLGFSLYLLHRLNNLIIEKIINVYLFFINWTPMVVFLMILYYIVFKNFKISGVLVSILGFTFIFGSYIFSTLNSYINVIDKSQIEGALALGYTDTQAFFRVLLPQAILNILPGFKGQAIELLKGTSIVGYLAVSDLARAGDLVRAMTFDAIFPLLFVTLLYIVLGLLLQIIIINIEKKLNPFIRSKEEIIKQIKND